MKTATKQWTVASTIAITVAILGGVNYFVDVRTIRPAMIIEVTQGDIDTKDALQQHYDLKLNGIQQSVNITVGNDAGRSIIRFYRSRCEGRATADIMQLLDENYIQYEEAKGRKHNFEGKPFTEVCGILGVDSTP